MFLCEYCEFFKNTYFEEHLRTIAPASSILLYDCHSVIEDPYQNYLFDLLIKFD